MVVCLRQLNAGGIMRSCDPLRDFQKMCQVLLTISVRMNLDFEQEAISAEISNSENPADKEIPKNDDSENNADSDFDENEEFVDDDFLEM